MDNKEITDVIKRIERRLNEREGQMLFMQNAMERIKIDINTFKHEIETLKIKADG